MFGASSTTEWHLNYDTTAQWYAPVNACQAAVIFTAGQLPYAKVTVCCGWVSVEATADVGNQPDAASLQAGLNEAWTMYCSPLSRNLCDALPSSLSNLAAHYDYFCVHEAAKVMLSSPRPLCLRLGLHKLAFAVASLCVDPAVVRSHAVWVYTDTSALETYEHTSYTVPHIVNRSMWMGRHQERHTAIFVPLREETGLASCPVWWGKRSMWPGSSRCSCRESTSCSLTMTRHRPPSSRSRTCSNFA